MLHLIFATALGAVSTGTGQVAADGSFACPAGSSLKTLATPGWNLRAEWCVDADGARHGPFRLFGAHDGWMRMSTEYRAGRKHGLSLVYDDEGRLVARVRYEDGHEVGTEAGPGLLASVVAAANARAPAQERGWVLEALDERSVRYTITTPEVYAWMAPDWRALQWMMPGDARVCRMFELPGVEVARIEVRFVGADGAVLGEMTLEPADCARFPARRPR